jgi:hypothetical protein
MNINGFGKATREMIDSFERHIGFSLPEGYRQFLCKYNGGIVSAGYSFYVNEDRKTSNEPFTK